MVGSMKQLLKIVGIAVVGGALGSAIRQLVDKEDKILVVASKPLPIAVGTAAGLLVPKGKPIVAFLVSLNLSANLRS